MSLCRQQSCAAGPSFEVISGDMTDAMECLLEDIKKLGEEKKIAQDISSQLATAMEELLEDAKKMRGSHKKEIERLKKEIESAEGQKEVVEDENQELKEEIEEWKRAMTDEYVEEEEATPDGLRGYLEQKTDEIAEWKEVATDFTGSDEVDPDDFREQLGERISGLEEEVERWENVFMEFSDDPSPDNLHGYMEETERLKKRCISDGLEYLLEEEGIEM